MSKLTPEPDSTDGGKKMRLIIFENQPLKKKKDYI
jgi:hypothetical protein